MDKKLLSQWEKDINQVLKSSRSFMKSCNKAFGKGFIGELLVFQQLIKVFKKDLLLDGNEIRYFGSSKKDYDFELMINNKKYEINAKGTLVVDRYNNPKWVRQHASMFCIIENKKGKTIITSYNKFKKNYYYCYVNVNTWLETGKASLFIVSDKEAKNIFGKKYQKSNNNKQIRKNNSDDMWIEYQDLAKHRDNSFSKLKK